MSRKCFVSNLSYTTNIHDFLGAFPEFANTFEDVFIMPESGQFIHPERCLCKGYAFVTMKSNYHAIQFLSMLRLQTIYIQDRAIRADFQRTDGTKPALPAVREMRAALDNLYQSLTSQNTVPKTVSIRVCQIINSTQKIFREVTDISPTSSMSPISPVSDIDMKPRSHSDCCNNNSNNNSNSSSSSSSSSSSIISHIFQSNFFSDSVCSKPSKHSNNQSNQSNHFQNDLKEPCEDKFEFSCNNTGISLKRVSAQGTETTELRYDSIYHISSLGPNELFLCLTRPPRITWDTLKTSGKFRASRERHRVCTSSRHARMFCDRGFLCLCVRFDACQRVPNWVMTTLRGMGYTPNISGVYTQESDASLAQALTDQIQEWSILDHEVVYVLQCLVSHDLVPLDAINNVLFLSQFIVQLPETSEQMFFLSEMFRSAVWRDDGCVGYEPLDLVAKMQEWSQWKEKNRIEYLDRKQRYWSRNHTSWLSYVKHVQVTPLRTLFLLPELVVSNRVIRKFSRSAAFTEALDDNGCETKMNDKPDEVASLGLGMDCGDRCDFLRVSFVDETESERLRYSEDVGDRMNQIMQQGIRCVDGQTYSFLAFSNSQLRTQSSWFYRNNSTATCDQIRAWMGDFSEIKNVAKNAARMGMCFSATTSQHPVDPKECLMVQDIKRPSPDNNTLYNFTDGAGMISKTFATEIARTLNLPRVPSAFQFRYAGFKGVVVTYDFDNHPCVQSILQTSCTSVNNDLNNNCNNNESHSGVSASIDAKGVKLILRHSQKKFESSHHFFEVVRTSMHPIRCHLNRQLISLLDTRSIRADKFIKLQDDMINNLLIMMQDEQYAVEMLRKYSAHRSVSGMLCDMLRAGMRIEDDPFIRECLVSTALVKFGELESKCRIFVEKGAFLLGVCDETKILKYGQCFIKHDKSVITGKVAVAKNPAFHPGDLRLLEAVDVAGLRHINNCVVFPVNGERDHPNECSGSDLDGDLYFVCWDQDLVPKTCNFEPMDYTPAEPQLKEDGVTMPDIIEFFIKMFKNDQLGRIANAHLAQYAFAPNAKLRKPECVELARLHSVSVDYPKVGGKPIEVDRKLIPNRYPLFMQKSERPSERALGCVVEELFLELKNCAIGGGLNRYASGYAKFDLDLIVDGYQTFLECARRDLKYYTADIKNFLQKYGIKRETDLVTNSIKKYVKNGDYKRLISEQFANFVSQCKHQFKMKSVGTTRAPNEYTWNDVNDMNDMNDMDDGKDLVIEINVGKSGRVVEYEDKKNVDIDMNAASKDEAQVLTKTELQQKASAYYFVTYGGNKRNDVLSMPWVVCHEILCNIKGLKA